MPALPPHAFYMTHRGFRWRVNMSQNVGIAPRPDPEPANPPRIATVRLLRGRPPPARPWRWWRPWGRYDLLFTFGQTHGLRLREAICRWVYQDRAEEVAAAIEARGGEVHPEDLLARVHTFTHRACRRWCGVAGGEVRMLADCELLLATWIAESGFATSSWEWSPQGWRVVPRDNYLAWDAFMRATRR